ncbi:THUMP domain-containing protein 1, partial [Rhizoclosmatium hyalinum]
MREEKKKVSHFAKQHQLARSKSVQPKMQGILGFCTRNKEQQATRELMGLLEDYGNKLYGEFKPDEEETKLDNDDDDDDEDGKEEGLSIEDAFAKEVAEFKKPAKKNAHRFRWMQVGIECCLFVRCHKSVCPTTLVQFILNDLNESKIQKTKYMQRILPAAESCLAFMDQIIPMANRVLPKYFSGEGMEPKKFAVVFSRRNNETVDRETLTPQLAAIATATVPHTVDLKNPDLCIIVEVFKSICTISVVERYYELKKFNLES